MPSPPPFPTGEPAVVRELMRPENLRPDWDCSGAIDPDSLRLAAHPECVPDKAAESLLPDSAIADLLRFWQEARIPARGRTTLYFHPASDLPQEAFRIVVAPDGIHLAAPETEGMRRAIYHLEQMIRQQPVPALPFGSTEKRMWLKNRISRCFFGPIKRPPFLIDELMNDIDYYPDEYLNRLAREGINGLWLTVEFRELARTRFRPVAPDADRRLEKLRRTVEQCRRYGIRIWIFCIEPARWSAVNPPPPELRELVGPPVYFNPDDSTFCPAGNNAREYLYESVYSIFHAVPGLGGMITIAHGERPTSCLSNCQPFLPAALPCAKRCGLGIADILPRVLTPMADGMHAAAPEAELIAWLYMPQPETPNPWIYEMTSRLDRRVTLAMNFESGCTRKQLGKLHTGGDYWLSCVGPSERFERMAEHLQGKCELAAKLQVCCSHELATAPFIPVPGLLYRKYRAMRKLGVTSVIQCWFFGNSPGLMNRAAGMLARQEDAMTEREFLIALAAPEWGADAAAMAELWEAFAEAYANYPFDIQFQYYGPFHDGTVWPLHLRRCRRRLPRSWKPENFAAGDAIGECLGSHTLAEAVVLTRRLSDLWHAARLRFAAVASNHVGNRDRELDAILYEALDIQFESGANILEFYLVRNQLCDAPPGAAWNLSRIEAILRREIDNSTRLAELCRLDPRLGYHAEAEVYKYNPERLEWRVRCLRDTLTAELPACLARLPHPRELADYLTAEPAECRQTGIRYTHPSLAWEAESDGVKLTIRLDCLPLSGANDRLTLYLMDEKMEKMPYFLQIAPDGALQENMELAEVTRSHSADHGQRLSITVPLATFAVRSGILFGLRRTCGAFVLDVPQGDFSRDAADPRLNLGLFSPEHLLWLKIVTA